MTREKMCLKLFPTLAAILCLALAANAAPGRAGSAPAHAPAADHHDDSEVVRNNAPVILKGRTLFNVQERIFSFSPEERARAISEKIRRLYEDPKFSIDSIRLEEGETATEIVSGEFTIMAVTDRDAKAAGRPRQELAEEYAQLIRTVAKELKEDYSARSLSIGAAWALAATVALLLAFKLLGNVFPKIYRNLATWKGTRIRPLLIQQVQLLSAERITEGLVTLAKAARIGVTVVLFYVYLPLVFSFFPWTHGWAAVLFDYIMRPIRLAWDGLTTFLPDLFFILVIVTVAFYVVKFVKFIFAEVRKGTIELPGFYPEWADPTYKITRFLMIAFTAIVVFPYLPGSNSPAFQGVSIFLGVLFSLGSTSAVSNVVGGIVLTYTRAFQIGDRVKIGDAVGDVFEKTLLVTRVRTVKNVDISIPNAVVLGSHVINFSSSARAHGLVLHTSVTIGYDAPWRQVHELLLAAAQMTPDILREPAPYVLQTGLGDFYVSYELNAYTDRPAVMARTYSELHQNIQDKFNEAGVEIMSPHYGAMRDGNRTTIPEDYLPKDYAPPPFRVLPIDDLFSPKNGKPG